MYNAQLYHPNSHLEGLAYQQRQVHSRNATKSHRPRFQKNQYRSNDPLQTTLITHHSANSYINHQAVHPKFRPWFYTRQHNNKTHLSTPTVSHSTNFSFPIEDHQMPLIELHPTNRRTLTNTTKSPGLRQIFTLKPQTPKQIENYYFQQQLRALFGHHQYEHHHPSGVTRSNIKTGLR